MIKNESKFNAAFQSIVHSRPLVIYDSTYSKSQLDSLHFIRTNETRFKNSVGEHELFDRNVYHIVLADIDKYTEMTSDILVYVDGVLLSQNDYYIVHKYKVPEVFVYADNINIIDELNIVVYRTNKNNTSISTNNRVEYIPVYDFNSADSTDISVRNNIIDMDDIIIYSSSGIKLEDGYQIERVYPTEQELRAYVTATMIANGVTPSMVISFPDDVYRMYDSYVKFGTGITDAKYTAIMLSVRQYIKSLARLRVTFTTAPIDTYTIMRVNDYFYDEYTLDTYVDSDGNTISQSDIGIGVFDNMPFDDIFDIDIYVDGKLILPERDFYRNDSSIILRNANGGERIQIIHHSHTTNNTSVVDYKRKKTSLYEFGECSLYDSMIYTDYDFCKYGIYRLNNNETPDTVEVFYSGKRLPSQYIERLNDMSCDFDLLGNFNNYIHISKDIDISLVYIRSQYNKTPNYITDVNVCDIKNAIAVDKYSDNMHPEQLQDYTDIFISEKIEHLKNSMYNTPSHYTDKEYIETLKNANYFGTKNVIGDKYIRENRVSLTGSGYKRIYDVVSNIITKNGLLKKSYTDSRYPLCDFNLRYAMNKIVYDEHPSYNKTNISIFNNLINDKFYFDFIDMRIKSLYGFDTVNISGIVLTTQNNKATFDFSYNDIVDVPASVLAKLPRYYTQSANDTYAIDTIQSGNVLLDLRYNPLSLRTTYDIRMKQLFSGVNVAYVDEYQVFDDSELLSAVNEYMAKNTALFPTVSFNKYFNMWGMFLKFHNFYLHDDWASLRNANIEDDVDILTTLTIDKNITNDITSFSGIEKCTNLTSLTISDQKCTSVSESWSQLTKLHTLTLTNNGTTTTKLSDFSFIEDNQAITTLNISKSGFNDSVFIVDIGSHIESLDISNTEYSGTGVPFLSCRRLKYLNMSDTSVTDIDDLYFSSSIETLICDNNNINSLYDSSQQKWLKKISLKNCMFGSLDFTEFMMVLEELYIDSNPFAYCQLYGGFGNRPMRLISMKECGITEVNLDGSVFNKMEDVDLSNNAITELTDIDLFYNHNMIKRFNLENNGIEVITGTLLEQYFNKDCEIYLSGNPLNRPSQRVVDDYITNRGWHIHFDATLIYRVNWNENKIIYGGVSYKKNNNVFVPITTSNTTYRPSDADNVSLNVSDDQSMLIEQPLVKVDSVFDMLFEQPSITITEVWADDEIDGEIINITGGSSYNGYVEIETIDDTISGVGAIFEEHITLVSSDDVVDDVETTIITISDVWTLI